ncbi:N-methyl-L-tryptophan oxidase [Alkalihalobacillus sp. MEB130]|uniref:N-methyl-L-tryptophan oxidase n=1 Tax=Alkalihalobacillus sp. MEB130 TaxID=2976704 RepID=UPI0028DD9EAF|nr:N-methyl-L-tryptophan oxidase [Alkalihalobacillus sp. MEB130]MDT8861359.1 N-methyl-L-tryptophan oxidase [Alkalihalobacillus sp. MEB130]
MSKYDVIVVGGGSMGSAACYYLSKKGKNVLMIDQFSIPNTFGSHHGHTRMLRIGYGNGGKYVPLVQESLKLWYELEKETGKELYKKTGALTVGHSESRFVKEAIDSSIQYNLPYEKLDAEQIMQRWPGIQIPGDYIGSYDPDSGFLLSEECIQTYKEEAMKLGADVFENQAVLAIDVQDEEVQVTTPNGVYTAAKLVATAGAWISKLLQPMELPITPMRKTIGWFKPSGKRLYGDNFPCFVFDTDSIGHYYGFPDFDGGGLKLGRMDQGYDCDPDTVNREFGYYADDEGDIRSFLEHFMPHAPGDLLKGAVSMFSNTPDHDFIIDYHPKYDHVIVAGGFSGHGFKFASVIGKILSDLSIDGETSSDISFLRLNRFANIKTM